MPQPTVEVVAEQSLIDCAEAIADAADRIERAVARFAALMGVAEPAIAELEALRQADGNPDELTDSDTDYPRQERT